MKHPVLLRRQENLPKLSQNVWINMNVFVYFLCYQAKAF